MLCVLFSSVTLKFQQHADVLRHIKFLNFFLSLRLLTDITVYLYVQKTDSISRNEGNTITEN